MTQPLAAAEGALEQHGSAVLASVHDSGSIESFQGHTAYFQSTVDETFTSMPSFDVAAEALRRSPIFRSRFGTDGAERIVLQFAYNMLTHWDAAASDRVNLDDAIARLTDEILDPEWVFVLIGNLLSYQGPEAPIALTSEVTIELRNSTNLRNEFGWSDAMFDRLIDDMLLSPGGVSQHLIILRTQRAARRRSRGRSQLYGSQHLVMSAPAACI